jgi:galactoside O-acetyltransferase
MFLTQEQLEKIGFAYLGNNVLLSDKCSIYSPENIFIGHNVRIDDFSILSGNISIGNYVHIACQTSLIGKGRIRLSDYSSVSGGSKIYSSSDSFLGDSLVGPTIPEELRNVKHKDVYISRFVTIGANSVILPGVKIGENSAIGACSLVTKDVPGNGIYAGNPLKFIKERQLEVYNKIKEIKW